MTRLILRDTDLHVLAGGHPEAVERAYAARRSTPPSPEKAALYRMRQELPSLARDCAWFAGLVIAAVPVVFVAVVLLAR